MLLNFCWQLSDTGCQCTSSCRSLIIIFIRCVMSQHSPKHLATFHDFYVVMKMQSHMNHESHKWEHFHESLREKPKFPKTFHALEQIFHFFSSKTKSPNPIRTRMKWPQSCLKWSNYIKIQTSGPNENITVLPPPVQCRIQHSEQKIQSMEHAQHNNK